MSTKKNALVTMMALWLILARLPIVHAYADVSPQKPLSLSYTPGLSGHLLLSAHLSNHPTASSATFLVDTGSSVNFITDTLAARLGLKSKPTPVEEANSSLKSGHSVDMVRVPSLESGALRLDNSLFVVLKAEELHNQVGEIIDGMLGNSLLKHYVVLFDFQQHQITLWKNDHFSPIDRSQIGMKDAFSVPMTEEIGDFLVPISVNGIEDKAFVDTGVCTTLLSTERAQSLHLQPLITQLDTIYADVTQQQYSQASASIQSLSVGGFVWHNPIVQYPVDKNFVAPRLLGLDFLAQHRLLLDYPQRRMYFQPVAQRAYSIAFQIPAIGLPLLNATLSDGKSHLFVLDPSQTSYLDTAFAKTLMKSSSVAAGQWIHTNLRIDNTPLAYDEKAFYVADHTLEGGRSLGLVGVIGNDILSCYAVRMDFVKKQFDLITPGHLAGTSYIPQDAQRFPLVLTKDGYALQMIVDGQPAWFTINPNFAYSVLHSQELIKKLHLEASPATSGVEGDLPTLHLHEIQIGKFAWKSPVVQDGSGASDISANMLGTDFLSRYIVVMDFPDQSLYLAPNPDAPSDQPGSRTGMQAGITAEGKLIVLSVAPSSPAEVVGIQASDEIVSINDIPAEIDNLDKIRAEIKQAEKEIVIVVKRKGEDMLRTFHLKPSK